jgi:hypothetical protein
MTMPHERTRALRQVGELLRTIRSRKDVPADLRQQAGWALRHYPEPSTIEQMARDSASSKDMQWLDPEET